MTDEQRRLVAEICHLGWVAFQIAARQPYNLVPDEGDLRSHGQAIRAMEANPEMTAKENHENWANQRLSEGWEYWPVKHKACKRHPDLVPYEDLPDIERRKDEADIVIRRAAIRLITGE